MNRAAILSFLILVLGAPTTLQAQTTVPSKPLEVTSTRESLAITYPEGPEIDVKFQGTYRLPSARGEAHVERKKGTTEIDIRLDELKPAHLFGGDYTTSLTGSPDAIEAVKHMRDGARGKDPMLPLARARGLVPDAGSGELTQYLESRASLDTHILSVTGGITQRRFRDVQERLGFFANRCPFHPPARRQA